MKAPRLAIKLSLVLVALVLVAIAAMSIVTLGIIKNSVGLRLTEHRLRMASYLAHELETKVVGQGLASSDAGELLDRFHRDVGLQLTLRDPSGGLVNYWGRSQLELKPEELDNCRLHSYSIQRAAPGNYPAVITMPIGQESWYGLIQLGYPSSLYGVPFTPILRDFLIVLILLCAVSVVLAHYLVQPLQALLRSMRQIADGDLEHRVQIASNDEFGEVGGAFNEMTDRLVSLVRAQRELLAGVSHELRSPLTRMRLSIELAKDSSTSSTDTERYRTLEREIIDLDTLIDALLTLSRIDLLGEPLALEPVLIEALLNEVIEREANGIAERNIQLNVELSDYSLALYCHRALMRCAIQNVLNNAIKYSPANGIVVLQIIETDHTLFFAIRDEGMGVAREEMDRLFRPFYRSEVTRKKNISGLGLGLMLTKRIVEQHGGKLVVSSSEQRGSCFELQLPIA